MLNFWQELSTGQKVLIGIVVAIFGFAGYLFYTGSQPPPDLTISSYTQRVPTKSPIDPKKYIFLTVSVFDTHDGKLRITEYPDADRNASVTFDTDYRRTDFTLYHDPLIDIEAISDPYKRVLNYAAYNAVMKDPQGLLRRASLNADQMKQELAARTDMMQAVALIDDNAKTNIIASDLYKKVMDALKAYRAVPGDSTKDAAKAKAAHNVVTLAIEYINTLGKKKAEEMSRYVTTIDKILDDRQKAKLAAVKLPARPRRKPVAMAAAAAGG